MSEKRNTMPHSEQIGLKLDDCLAEMQNGVENALQRKNDFNILQEVARWSANTTSVNGKQIRYLKQVGLKVTLECDEHGRQEIELKHKHDEPYCPQCSAEVRARWLILREQQKRETAEEFKQQQAQREQQERRQRYEALEAYGIGKRYQNATLSAYQVDNNKQKQVFNAVKEYDERLPEMLEEGTNLIFTGAKGTGKTHLACALAGRAFVRYKKTIYYRNAQSLFHEIKSSFNGANKDGLNSFELMNRYKQCDLLIIDELGIIDNSDYEAALLFEILNARYENMKASILISNLSLKHLAQLLGERLHDRLRETSICLDFDWESHRLRR